VLLMAVLAAVGAFNIGTGAATTTVTVSSLWGEAEVPKAILFWWSGRTESTNAFGSASHQRGHGWAVGASSFHCVTALDVDGGGSADTYAGQRSDACIAMLAPALNWTDAAVGWADVQSVGNGSFTLEILDAFSVDLRVSYLALGGSDISATTGTDTSPVGGGADSFAHSLGATPAAVFFMGMHDSDAPTVRIDSSLSFGAATANADQAVWSGGSNDNATSGATGTYCRSGEAYALNDVNPTVSPNNRMEFVSVDATNINVTWPERGNAMRVHWLAIAGGSWKLGSLTTQTDTTTTFGTGSLGFTPRAAMFVSACKAAPAADATPSAHDEWTVGAATSTSNRTCQQSSSRNGNTNMFVQTGLRTDAVYVNADPDTDAIEGLADINAWGSDSFDLIMDDADPSGAFLWYVAVGEVVAGGGFVPYPRPRGLHGGMGGMSGGMH
jgi:hypothetical protein